MNTIYPEDNSREDQRVQCAYLAFATGICCIFGLQKWVHTKLSITSFMQSTYLLDA